MTDIITDEMLDSYAADLAPRLTKAIDWIWEMEDRRQRVLRAPEQPTGAYLCRDSDLDFMARIGHQYPVPITAKYTKSHARQFRPHVVLCSRCTVREQCEEMGQGEPIGIWGGKLPHERET